jgi:hypothetical protein
MGAPLPRRSSDWRLVLALGVALVAGYYFLPSGGPAQALILTLINGFAAVSALRIATRAEPRTRTVWAALGAGTALSTVAELSRCGYPLPFPAPVGALWLLTYPCFIVALLSFAGLRHAEDEDAGSFGGATLLAMSGGIVLWSFVLAPFVDLIDSVASPALDVVFLVAVLRVVSSTRGIRNAAGDLLLTGFVVLLAGAILYTVQLDTGTYHLGGPCDGLWLLSYLLLAVAAQQPAARSLAASGAESHAWMSAGRLGRLAAAH